MVLQWAAAPITQILVGFLPLESRLQLYLALTNRIMKKLTPWQFWDLRNLKRARKLPRLPLREIWAAPWRSQALLERPHGKAVRTGKGSGTTWKEKGPAVPAFQPRLTSQSSHRGIKHRNEAIMNVPAPATTLLQPHERPKCKTTQRPTRWTPVNTQNLRNNQLAVDVAITLGAGLLLSNRWLRKQQDNGKGSVSVVTCSVLCTAHNTFLVGLLV